MGKTKSVYFALVLSAFLAVPSWALIDGIVAGAKAAKDEAHKRIVENQLIQLLITTKKNYDASIKIYKEARRLNEGKGILHNVANDLAKRASKMAEDEAAALQGEFSYHNDSQLDKFLADLDEKTKNAVEGRGKKSLGFMDGVNRESAQYADAIKKQFKGIADRSRRGQATKDAGVKISEGAKTATDQALGLELQAVADQTEALNQLLALISSAEAKEKIKEVNQRQSMEELLDFFSDAEGAQKQVAFTGALTDPVRIPALYSRQRANLGSLVLTLLGLFVAWGLIWAFMRMWRNKDFSLHEVVGVPLIFVLFGLVAYDSLFVRFAIVLRTVEETVAPWDQVTQTFYAPAARPAVPKGPAPKNAWERIKRQTEELVRWGAGFAATSWVAGFSLVASGAALIVVEAFYWTRYALLALCYVLGPLMIAFYLLPPLRKVTTGWLMTCLELGLNGIGMRVFMAVIASSSIQALFDTAAGAAGMAFTALIVNLVFLGVAVAIPFLVHSIIHGSMVSAALILPTWSTANTVQGAGRSLFNSALDTKRHLAKVLTKGVK